MSARLSSSHERKHGGAIGKKSIRVVCPRVFPANLIQYGKICRGVESGVHSPGAGNCVPRMRGGAIK